MLLVLVGLLAGGLGASGSAGEISGDPAQSASATYEVHGVLQSVDLPHRQATIAHEEIPAYMPAMTMSFDVRDPASLPTLRPGDALAFRLCVNGASAWIDQVRRTGAPVPGMFAPGVVSPTSELAVGDFLPDIAWVGPLGQTRHLSDFRGQVLALTFVYARCPLPNYCPLMNRNFAAAQSLLTRMGAKDDWHFLSISLDAAHDSPDVLANLATAYGAEPRHWTFVTASETDVRLLGRAVGLQFDLSAGRISHNLRTVVVDAAGRIRRIYRGNAWTPQDLAADVRAALPRLPAGTTG